MATHESVTTSSAILGAVLIKLRMDKGLKQSDIAQQVGVGTSTWSRFERGEGDLSVDQLRLTAKVLGCTPGEIIELTEAAEQVARDKNIKIEPLGTSATTLLKVDISACIPVLGSVLGDAIGIVVAPFLKRKKTVSKT